MVARDDESRHSSSTRSKPTASARLTSSPCQSWAQTALTSV
jgi:hypothetical protein